MTDNPSNWHPVGTDYTGHYSTDDLREAVTGAPLTLRELAARYNALLAERAAAPPPAGAPLAAETRERLADVLDDALAYYECAKNWADRRNGLRGAIDALAAAWPAPAAQPDAAPQQADADARLGALAVAARDAMAADIAAHGDFEPRYAQRRAELRAADAEARFALEEEIERQAREIAARKDNANG